MSIGTDALVCLLIVAVMLDTAHNLSPIVMAWTHREFREVMCERLGKYVLVPAAVLGLALAIGASTSLGMTGYDLHRPHQMWRVTGLDNPLPLMAWLYWSWNIYHFGAQNFGIVRLARHRWKMPGPRLLDRFVCLGTTAVGMLLLPFWIGLALFSFTHWLAEVALTTYVSSNRRWFLASVLALGGLAFIWTVPPWRHEPYHGNLVYAAPVLLGLRMGMGFVHFLYDRWVWKFSDPQVRATIGTALLAA